MFLCSRAQEHLNFKWFKHVRKSFKKLKQSGCIDNVFHHSTKVQF
uniref:Uncharacterized protein n=1 Tax=Arundo donax TaxID=35708 RepID=A0A0A8YMX8_ARUDO